MTTQMKGALYFLVNDTMPGLVKIGHTTGELGIRLQQLNSTGVPAAFRIIAVFHVSNARGCEAEVHRKLQKYRANPKREFFAGSPHMLISESLEIVGPYLAASSATSPSWAAPVEYAPDEDDISFMFYLLHDGYQRSLPLSASYLAEHHMRYSPIELDLKLMKLEERGYVNRVNRDGIGNWILTPMGMKFMIEGGHHAQELLDESKRS
jgi:hypothetical protein